MFEPDLFELPLLLAKTLQRVRSIVSLGHIPSRLSPSLSVQAHSAWTRNAPVDDCLHCQDHPLRAHGCARCHALRRSALGSYPASCSVPIATISRHGAHCTTAPYLSRHSSSLGSCFSSCSVRTAAINRRRACRRIAVHYRSGCILSASACLLFARDVPSLLDVFGVHVQYDQGVPWRRTAEDDKQHASISSFLLLACFSVLLHDQIGCRWSQPQLPRLDRATASVRRTSRRCT